MPENLIPQRPITTTEAPRTNLSAGQIAAPFADLANTLDKVSGAAEVGAEQLATKAGEEAGRKSVRTADDGSLVVGDTSNPFIIGNAAKDYEKAAKLSQFAQIQPKIETDVLGLRLANPNNPKAFKAAADAYAKDTVANVSDPHIADAVSDTLNTNIQHNLRSSMVEANQANTTEALQTFQDKIKDLNERMGSLARQGGTGPPEYLAAAKDRAAAWNSLQQDPRFKFSKERADLEINEAFSNDKVQEVIGRVQRQFLDDHDMAKARQTLNDAFWGKGSESLNLTATKRDHGVAEGIHALTNLDATDKEAVTENRRATAGYLVDLQTNPRQFDLGQHLNMVEHAKTIGDFRSMHELEEAQRFQPLWSAFHSASPNDQAEMLGELRRGLIPKGPVGKIIEQEATRTGLPVNFLQRVAQIESSGNPNNRTGSYKGLFQLSDAEFAKYGKPGGDIFNAADNAAAGANSLRARFDAFKEKYGRDPSATELYMAHQQGEGGLSNHLASPDLPAWQNMLNTAEGRQKGVAWARATITGNGGTLDMTSREFMGMWQRKVEGTLIPGQQIELGAATPTSRLFESTVKEARQVVSKNAQTSWERIERLSKEGNTIQPDDLQHFGEMALRAGRDDLIDKAAPLMRAQDIANGLPPGTTSDVLKSQLEEIKAAGVDPVTADTVDHLEKLAEAGDKRLAESPLTEGARRGWTGGTRQLDITNPAAVGGEMAARQKSLGVISQPDHAPNIGPTSAIMPQEGQRLATALTQGDPKTATAILGQIKDNLSAETYRATMAAPAMKEAVIGMSTSNDPARMDAGMKTLDALWMTKAPDFEATYGGTALTRLLAWKGLQSLTPEKRVEVLNRADDPFMHKGREEVAKATEKEFASTKPQDAANALGNWFQRNVPFVNAPVPMDAVSGGALNAQYKDTIRALRMYNVDPDSAQKLAVERLTAQWQPSKLAGGALMKNAPESHYPPVDGSHDWMQKELSDQMEAAFGPKVLAITENAPPTLNWELKGLISDGQTEREIADHKPPTYQIVVTDKNGQMQLSPARFAPNPQAYQAGAVRRAKAEFDRMHAVPYRGLDLGVGL